MDGKALALRFESLGGGCLDGERWGFGCEFALFQRELGAEPLGLLRWASLSPSDLIRALDEDFISIDREEELSLWGELHYGYRHHGYRLRCDRSDQDARTTPMEVARRNIATLLGFLRGKLLEDLEDGRKIFVYRMLDEVPEPQLVTRLAAAVSRHGPDTLLFLQPGEREEVRRLAPNLLLGTATRFASNGENQGFEWQWDKWMQLSRDALEA